LVSNPENINYGVLTKKAHVLEESIIKFVILVSLYRCKKHNDNGPLNQDITNKANTVLHLKLMCKWNYKLIKRTAYLLWKKSKCEPENNIS
jgi:hypothetical protein